MIQTLTKFLGIFAFILTFALSTTAQQRTIKTQLSGDNNTAETCYNFCGSVKAKYIASGNKLSIKVLDVNGSQVQFLYAAIIGVSGSGPSRQINKTYSRYSTKYYNLDSFGMHSGYYTLVMTGLDGFTQRMSFYVN